MSRLSHAQIPNMFTGPVKIKVPPKIWGLDVLGTGGTPEVKHVDLRGNNIFGKFKFWPSQELWWGARCCWGHCGLDYMSPGGKFGVDFSRVEFGVVEGLER